MTSPTWIEVWPTTKLFWIHPGLESHMRIYILWMRGQMLLKESPMYSLGNALHHQCPILCKLCSIDEYRWPALQTLGASWGQTGIFEKRKIEQCMHYLLQCFASSILKPIAKISILSYIARPFPSQVAVFPLCCSTMADWDWENPILTKICAYFDNVQNLVYQFIVISSNSVLEPMWVSAMLWGNHGSELWGVYLQEMSWAPPHEEGGCEIILHSSHHVYCHHDLLGRS